jgi:nucleoid-associated protein YgaU
MPKDARLGLVVGVGLVIGVAVVFYRGAAIGQPLPGNLQKPSAAPGSMEAQVSALPGIPPTLGPPRSHVVQEGESLASVANRYYGDPRRSVLLYRANRDHIRSPDRVPIGTILLIPDLPPELASAPGQR